MCLLHPLSGISPRQKAEKGLSWPRSQSFLARNSTAELQGNPRAETRTLGWEMMYAVSHLQTRVPPRTTSGTDRLHTEGILPALCGRTPELEPMSKQMNK